MSTLSQEYGWYFVSLIDLFTLSTHTHAHTHTQPQESRIITQLHYIHWPRSSAPSNTRSIIDLIDQLQRVQRKSGNGPITVHCE